MTHAARRLGAGADPRLAAARCTPPARGSAGSGAWRSARRRSSCEHPAVLIAVLAAEALAALAAGLERELRRTAAWGVPFALAVVVINALVTRDGATVFFRGSHLPWAGQFDVTVEAIAYGAVLGLRILAIFGTAVFLTAAVDPTSCCALRRVSLRSGVTAALAMRLFGVLAATRGATPTRSAACRAAAPRGRGPARGHDRRARSRDRRRRDARGPRLRHRRAPAADAAARGRATTSPSRPPRSRCSRSRSASGRRRGGVRGLSAPVGTAHAGRR